MNRATAFAPATVANLAVGFDLLGFAFPARGDRVTVTRVETSDDPVRLVRIAGIDGLPTNANDNTATRALLAMVEDLGLPFGVEVEIDKGIPLGSGMGGSAASAVGAVVAANALLDTPMPKTGLLEYALAGESIASGAAMHGDNVVPCLFGGLCAYVADSSEVIELPLPPDLRAVVVRPEQRLDTEAQRASLSGSVPLAAHVQQSAQLLAFVDACHRGDSARIGRAMQDLVVGPQRLSSIVGGAEALAAALEAGAIGGAIAGSGPSLFAWTTSVGEATAVASAMRDAFQVAGVSSQSWVEELPGSGAAVVLPSDA